jgi:hypothetical protein
MASDPASVEFVGDMALTGYNSRMGTHLARIGVDRFYEGLQVPELSTMMLSIMAVLGLVAYACRRRK